ncbi:MAG TPA: EAL domain-containing protein [Erythrobacter sp.]|nr:EAL domain-containing protein [Erythrobacter sp.]
MPGANPMLLIVSETVWSNRTVNDVIREMSFTPSFFASPATFSELLSGQARRVVLIGENDITREVLHALTGARGRTPFGIIVAANRASLRGSENAELVERLANFDNIEWVGQDFDFDHLSASARRCRRRMLKVAQRELEEAVDNGEIVLRYQPKVERNSGRDWLTREAEALVRWQHPRHGLIGPLEFLPEAEAFGMMGRISEFVLREACEQQLRWREQGIVLGTCINLASSQLCKPGMASHYRDVVVDFGLECANFTFEVIGQDLSNPEAPHVAAIKALRNHGFRVCLDDFRVAATSLSAFEQLPFDEIKIHA